jgi:hypothetical protein
MPLAIVERLFDAATGLQTKVLAFEANTSETDVWMENADVTFTTYLAGFDWIPEVVTNLTEGVEATAYLKVFDKLSICADWVPTFTRAPTMEYVCDAFVREAVTGGVINVSEDTEQFVTNAAGVRTTKSADPKLLRRVSSTTFSSHFFENP